MSGEDGADQIELFVKVNKTKKRVIEAIGARLSHEFRSTHAYQSYAGLCGEAQMEFEDGELRQETVDLLVEYAERVIADWRKEKHP